MPVGVDRDIPDAPFETHPASNAAKMQAHKYPEN
jgi:hypothetical protein